MRWKAMLLWVMAASPLGAAIPDRLTIEVGQETVLDFPGATRVALGDPSIGDVHVSERGEVLLVGKASGKTTLIVWQGGNHRSMEIEVTTDRAQGLAVAVHGLRGCEGLEVRGVNGKTVITGRLATLEAYRDLHHLLGDDPSVVMMVELDHQARLAVVDWINEALAKAGIHEARAEQVGDRIFLEGQVEDEEARKRAQVIADSVAGEALDIAP